MLPSSTTFEFLSVIVGLNYRQGGSPDAVRSDREIDEAVRAVAGGYGPGHTGAVEMLPKSSRPCLTRCAGSGSTWNGFWRMRRFARRWSFSLMAFCGLRASEVTRLMWIDVDFALSRLLVRGKDGRERIVDIRQGAPGP